MKRMIATAVVVMGILSAQMVHAQAPAGATGLCKDGTYATSTSKSAGCRGHQGVKEWYADAASGQSTSTKSTSAKSAPATTAAAPAKPASGAAPAGATGLCKDGTYATSASKSAGCRGHQGVQTWYADSAAPAKPAPAAAPAPAPRPTPTQGAAAPAPAAKSSPSSTAAAKPQAAGGGPGMVWVNTSSNVYHCYGSTYYGTTKAGSYMSESEAKSKGARPDHGKACSQ